MSENRNDYRKNLKLTGYLVHEGGAKRFYTKNISLSGMQAHFDRYPATYRDILVCVHLPSIRLMGYVYSIWQKPTEDGGIDMGFEFFLKLVGVENRL